MSITHRVLRRGTALYGTVLVAAALVACDGPRERFEDDEHATVRITEIRVEGGSGDVIVGTGEKSGVDIHRTVYYRKGRDRPQPIHRIDGSILYLDTSCDDGCSVSYAIRAPEGVPVSGRNGSGDLRLTNVSTVDFELGSGSIVVRNASGPVTVRTGSGDIQLVDVRGKVSARTASGSIDAVDVRTTTLEATTGSGDVGVQLADIGDVRAETSSGDIRVAVPGGPYRVTTGTGSGDVQVRIASDLAAPHHLDLRTGSGDIAVNPR